MNLKFCSLVWYILFEIKKGFIHLKDAIPQIDETKEKLDESIEISKVLKLKQNILIQVKKDSDEIKGARVSTHISLPGKYIVLMPNTSIITISQKIEDEKKRQELKDLIKNILPKNFGVIIRTSAENAKNEEMKTDLEQLLKTWNDINNKYKKSADSPQLIWKSENIVEKIITDLSRKDLVITTNSKEEFDKLTKSYKETEIKEVSKGKWMMNFGATLDERIADGFYFCKALKLIEYMCANPEILMEKASKKVSIDKKD